MYEAELILAMLYELLELKAELLLDILVCALRVCALYSAQRQQDPSILAQTDIIA